MTLPIPRLHLIELADQSWFPISLRSRVQDQLTEFWTYELPPIQKTPPATLVVQILRDVLGARLRSYTFVDFCAGGGGPTPFVEREINNRSTFRKHQEEAEAEPNGPSSREHMTDGKGGDDPLLLSSPSSSSAPSNELDQSPVDFILTDLHPHVSAWQIAQQASPHLRYVPVPVDATMATADQVLKSAQPALPPPVPAAAEATKQPSIFRLFNLAFHHFNDELAVRVLRNTLETSAGFAIFELQGRDWGSLFTVPWLWPVMVLGSWGWYWGQWTELFLHGIVPIVPTILLIDGLVSCLRTRTHAEVDQLLRRAAEDVPGGLEGWTVEVGERVHTWPLGKLTYFIATKK